VSTKLTPKEPTDKSPVDLVGTAGAGSAKVVERVEQPRWDRPLRFALPVVLVGTFLAFAWTSGAFRAGLAVIAPHVAILLWAAVAVGLAVSIGRRYVGSRVVEPENLAELRVLLAPAALSASVIAYLVRLFASWADGGSSFFTIGGVVPWSDANTYVGGAQRLLFDGQLDAFNSRRPLQSAFLATELAFTRLDLRGALVLQAILLGVATYLAARAVARDLGPLAGLALFAGIYGFARIGVDTAMTETLGVTLGALAFAALWSAVRPKNSWLVVAGMFLLAFAFDIRPGPVLLLLTLPIAFAWLLRGSRRTNWRLLGLSVVAVVVATSANYVAIFVFHGDTGNVNANSGYMIYGMSRGLPGWSSQPLSWYQLYLDHPEIRNMSETERNRFVNTKAREELAAHPGTFVRSYFEGASNYVRGSGEYATEPVSSLRLLVYAVAFVIGLLVLIVRWRSSSLQSVLLDAALFGGVLLALPTIVGAWPYDDHTGWGWDAVGLGSYLPSWFGAAICTFAYVAFILVGTARLSLRRHLWLAVVALATVAVSMPVLGLDTVRIFAAAVPFLAVPFAVAVAVIGHVQLGRDKTESPAAVAPKRESPGQTWLPVLIGGALAVLAVVGAPIAAVAVAKPAPQPRMCADGQLAQPLIDGVAVRIVGTERSGGRELDEVKISDVTSASTVLGLQQRGVFGRIHAPMTVVAGITERGHDRIAFVDGSVSATGDSVLYLCGRVVSDASSNPVLKEWPVPLDVFAGTAR
jgi:hypothetical protein